MFGLCSFCLGNTTSRCLEPEAQGFYAIREVIGYTLYHNYRGDCKLTFLPAPVTKFWVTQACCRGIEALLLQCLDPLRSNFVPEDLPKACVQGDAGDGTQERMKRTSPAQRKGWRGRDLTATNFGWGNGPVIVVRPPTILLVDDHESGKACRSCNANKVRTVSSLGSTTCISVL